MIAAVVLQKAVGMRSVLTRDSKAKEDLETRVDCETLMQRT
jgi:hypothetical protein